MLPFRRIFVALARADVDGDLLRYSGMLAADAGDTEWQFVHVLGGPGPCDGGGYQAALRYVVDQVAAHFPAGGGLNISCHVLYGSRVDRILEFAAEQAADLLLVGHRRNRTGRRSMARRLAMKAPCSILLVPESATPRLQRIQAAFDFSDPAAYALGVATALAQHRRLGECQVLHVGSSRTADGAQQREAISRQLDEFVARLDLHGVQAHTVLLEGSAVASKILEAAASHRADLIVMGSRGLSASAAVLLGSESEQTLMESPIPVLVAKRRGERLGVLEVLLDRDLRARPLRA